MNLYDQRDRMLFMFFENQKQSVAFLGDERQETYALQAETKWNLIMEAGESAIGVTFRDWIFKATELHRAPRKGDKILDGTDIWEALPIGTESHAIPMGPLVRVHCKRVRDQREGD